MVRCPLCDAELDESNVSPCPACGEPSVPVIVIDTGVPVSKQRRRGSKLLFILGVVVTISLLIRILIAAGRGDWGEAVYSAVAVSVIYYGLSLQATPQRASPVRVLVLVSVGIGLYIATQFYIPPNVDRAVIVGTVEGGEYQNRYFGFRVPFRPPWIDTTALAAKDAEDNEFKSILLFSLKRPSGEILGFAAEPVGLVDFRSARDFLQKSIPDAVLTSATADVRWDQQVIAGIPFEQISFNREFANGVVRMTFWASIRSRHALVIWGTSSSDDGMKRLQELLADAAPLE